MRNYILQGRKYKKLLVKKTWCKNFKKFSKLEISQETFSLPKGEGSRNWKGLSQSEVYNKKICAIPSLKEPRDWRYKDQYSKFKTQDSRFKIQYPRFKIQYPRFKISWFFAKELLGSFGTDSTNRGKTKPSLMVKDSLTETKLATQNSPVGREGP